MDKKTFCFDIDGTICTNTNGDYENAQPFLDRIEKVKQLHEEGHKIIFFTARGTTTGIDWSETTKKQLTAWGLKYHQILFGKPYADIFIDDRAVNDKEWFKNDKSSS